MEDNKDVQTTETVEQETTIKTYTKEDLDNSFNAGVKKANSEWQKDEKYKEFLEWKKTTQNDGERIKELEKIIESKETEIANYKSKEQINLLEKNEVKPQFQKFVLSEVSSLVNETTDFETALTNYKKDNSQYFGEPVIKKVQTSPVLAGGTQPTTANDIMNNLLRNR